MDRGAWQATVHEITRLGHDLVTKSHQIVDIYNVLPDLWFNVRFYCFEFKKFICYFLL